MKRADHTAMIWANAARLGDDPGEELRFSFTESFIFDNRVFSGGDYSVRKGFRPDGNFYIRFTQVR